MRTPTSCNRRSAPNYWCPFCKEPERRKTRRKVGVTYTNLTLCTLENQAWELSALISKINNTTSQLDSVPSYHTHTHTKAPGCLTLVHCASASHPPTGSQPWNSSPASQELDSLITCSAGAEEPSLTDHPFALRFLYVTMLSFCRVYYHHYVRMYPFSSDYQFPVTSFLSHKKSILLSPWECCERRAHRNPRLVWSCSLIAAHSRLMENANANCNNSGKRVQHAIVCVL